MVEIASFYSGPKESCDLPGLQNWLDTQQVVKPGPPTGDHIRPAWLKELVIMGGTGGQVG